MCSQWWKDGHRRNARRLAAWVEAPVDGMEHTGARNRVTVAFSEAVAVTGASRLKIDMDPGHWGAKWAARARRA